MFAVLNAPSFPVDLDIASDLSVDLDIDLDSEMCVGKVVGSHESE